MVALHPLQFGTRAAGLDVVDGPLCRRLVTPCDGCRFWRGCDGPAFWLSRHRGHWFLWATYVLAAQFGRGHGGLWECSPPVMSKTLPGIGHPVSATSRSRLKSCLTISYEQPWKAIENTGYRRLRNEKLFACNSQV